MMATIGLLSMSDGRAFAYRDVLAHCQANEDRITSELERAGHRVVRGRTIIGDNVAAVREARWVAAQRPDLTIFHYPVWAFPHFSMLAADATDSPLLLFSNMDPSFPGMVGLLAAGGGLDQLGRRHGRICGDIGTASVREEVERHARAAFAVRRLSGSTFGRIGGRPMGMYTAASSTEQWMEVFGVDVEEIDQWEIVRRSEQVAPSRAAAGREWIEKHAAVVDYDGKRLTPAVLERQIRAYHAVRELIDEWHLDFCGIKGQPELTTHFATTDVAEAFLNDPYDWEGPKAPVVCATESDMDGALTMQILHLLSGTPVLFADVRHYHAERDVWDLCNSGQHPTWYAARSEDPAENLARVRFLPETFYFPAGGASVRHIAAPGEMTFARLSRLDHSYRLQVVPGRLLSFGDAVDEELASQSNAEWPHAYAQLDVPAADFLRRFGANHIHAVPGDLVDDLHILAGLLGIGLDLLGTRREGAG
jgi:L-fucose isomerase